MQPILAGTLGLVVALLIHQLYRILFAGPLRTVPGPLITRFSSLWLALQARLGRRSLAVHRLHQQYGDVVRITSNHVSINRPEALNEIYQREKDFHKGPWYEEFNAPTPPLLAIYDHAEHAEQRRNLQPAFAPRSLREFEPEMDRNYRRWRGRLVELCEGGKAVEVDLNDWINYLAFDLIGQFSFGKPFGFVERGRDFLDLMGKMEGRLRAGTALGVLPLWLRPYMSRVPFDDFWRASAESIIGIRRVVQGAITERRASPPPAQGRDLLSYLLDAKSEGGSAVGDGQMLSHMVGLVIAGSDSTAASITHFVDCVSRDLELQEKVCEEIDAVFPGVPDAEWVPQYVDCQKLRYVTAALYEVLRLRPTAAVGMERYATHKELVFDGHVLPPGTLVSVPTYSLHRNAHIYPEPERFKPERWLAEDTTQQHKVFNLFSQGPRSCVGQTFAWMEMMKSITLLFKLFRFQRTIAGDTELYDGFFLKAVECKVLMKRR